jgi:methionyl-tRNA synthetase
MTEEQILKQKDKGFYITTPIYYVNDVPHIGHAYTTVAADVLARYKRMCGEKVFLITGTDEHGKKIQRSAEERGISPKALADEVVTKFKDAWKILNIKNDDFIRTTEERHARVVYEMWARMKANGDIYPGLYEGWYCIPDESYWTEKELVNGKCPVCGRDVERIKEESYFFRLSKYQQPLLEHIESNAGFILPVSRRNEILSFVRDGLKDLSITRAGFEWGIKVPDNPKLVIYVWLDALLNYLTAAGFLSDEGKFSSFWPPAVQIVGKDIIKFHAVFWPAFLMSAGLPLPKHIFAHGWWTIEGMKMSKSIGNVVSPESLVKDYGTDATRYFLMREVPFGLDGNFSQIAMNTRINSDLANDLGNLLSRATGMVVRFANGVLQAASEQDDADRTLIQKGEWLYRTYSQAMNNLEFHTALTVLWEFIGEANRYVDQTKPWQDAKSGNTARLNTRLYNTIEATRIAAAYLLPFMPDTAATILNALSQDIKGRDLEQLSQWGGAIAGVKITQAPPLFEKKLEKSKADTAKAEVGTSIPYKSRGGVTPPLQKHAEQQAIQLITIDHFKTVELKVGTILSAQKVEGSQKLIKLEVDIGEKRTIVAGIGKSYKPEELPGKRIVVVANLQPAELFGIQSQGMLLAAGDPEHLALLTLDRDAANGTRIK